MNTDYLRAEMAMAQQAKQKRLLVDVTELHALLHQLDHLKDLVDRAGKIPRKAGFAISQDLRNLCSGTHMFMKVKKNPTGRFDCPLYFLDIPKAEKPLAVVADT